MSKIAHALHSRVANKKYPICCLLIAFVMQVITLAHIDVNILVKITMAVDPRLDIPVHTGTFDGCLGFNLH